ncbi:MAG: ATP-binding protein [Candidatus Omnitrophica bacterium]|nr:ATP-binding protein [Candidatus Omnitrophota bacterium]MCG2704319.1 ATP-binding protein [Candidatus Omnitrophota bacterium]
MESREKLKKVLQEWAEFEIPALYNRDFDWRLLEGKEILSVIGARRTGKTYLCYQMAIRLRQSMPAANVIYVNFEDERLYPLKGDELTILWDMCRELFSIEASRRVYLFVDEIQNMKNWSKWARRITEQNPSLKLIITGSSSKLLSKEIATELRGRTLSFRVFPLSFAEYLRAKGVRGDVKNILYSKERPIIKKYFNAYLAEGGFPAVLESKNSRELLRGYYNVMFYRDVAERHKIKNIRLLEDYMTLLIDQTACNFSVSATAKKLMEFGHSFSKNTLINFSRYAQDAFFLFEVKKYSYKIREQTRAPKKIYVIDHGLVQAVRFSFQDNYGRLMENIVCIQLQRQNKETHYFKDKRECDFVAGEAGKVTEVFQVAKDISEAKTREREVEGLAEAMAHYKLKQGFILTEDYNEEIKIRQGRVTIVPLWYWLLDKQVAE